MPPNYLSAALTALIPLVGFRVRATFSDGFTGEVDLEPLLDCGPIFHPLREPAFFRGVVISPYEIPQWSDDLDLSPASLRAWCEAGRFMGYDETDRWIEEHSGAPQKVA